MNEPAARFLRPLRATDLSVARESGFSRRRLYAREAAAAVSHRCASSVSMPCICALSLATDGSASKLSNARRKHSLPSWNRSSVIYDDAACRCARRRQSLPRQGIQTPRGGQWSACAVRNVLLRLEAH